jgi:glycosyltransferase involved in cell wall biosynthesis
MKQEKTQPTVSVIIPVKNRAELLKITLRNILNQTHQPHEIFVIDDASTDHLPEVMAQFEGRVQFFNNPGSGPGAARNFGLSKASGKYIQFFDSDDLMTSNKLAIQIEALEKSGADMAYGPYVQATEQADGSWLQNDVVMQLYPLPEGKNLSSVLLMGWNCITQSCLFRSQFLKSAKPWNEQLITHEDYLYLFDLSLQNPYLVHTPGAGVIYRQHGAQSTASNTHTLSRAYDKLQVLMHMQQHLPKATFYEHMLFFGRCYLTTKHFQMHDGDVAVFRTFLGTKYRVASYLYRWHNKQERLLTGTNWETMHGVSKSKIDFEQLIEQVK